MVLDSSVLLEIFLSKPLKASCLREIKGKNTFIPSLVYYECYKKLRTALSDADATSMMASLQGYPTLNLTPEVALLGADLSVQFRLAMVDSLVLAHAKILNELLLTLDNDFLNIPNVKILRK